MVDSLHSEKKWGILQNAEAWARSAIYSGLVSLGRTAHGFGLTWFGRLAAARLGQ